MSAYRPAPCAWWATSAGLVVAAGEQRVERGLVQPAALPAEQLAGQRLADQRVPERELVLAGLDQDALVDQRRAAPGSGRPRGVPVTVGEQVERHPVAEHRGRLDDAAGVRVEAVDLAAQHLGDAPRQRLVSHISARSITPSSVAADDRSNSSRKNGFPPVRWCSDIAVR